MKTSMIIHIPFQRFLGLF